MYTVSGWAYSYAKHLVSTRYVLVVTKTDTYRASKQCRVVGALCVVLAGRAAFVGDGMHGILFNNPPGALNIFKYSSSDSECSQIVPNP